MPGPTVAIRFAVLTVFLVAVALGLWLLDVRPLLVVAGMAVALAIAWAIEWLAWRAEFAEPRTPRALLLRPDTATDAFDPVEEPAGGESWEPAAPVAPPASEPARRVPSFLPGAPPDAEAGAPGARDEAPATPAPAALPAEPKPKPESKPEPEAPRAASGGERPQAAAAEPPRKRPPLRPVPPPQPPPSPVTRPAARAESPVVPMRPRAGAQPREWNLWDLERLAREELKRDPARRDEWSFLFVHLRQYAKADGALPTEFDPLVRESFGGLLEGTRRP